MFVVLFVVLGSWTLGVLSSVIGAYRDHHWSSAADIRFRVENAADGEFTFGGKGREQTFKLHAEPGTNEARFSAALGEPLTYIRFSLVPNPGVTTVERIRLSSPYGIGSRELAPNEIIPGDNGPGYPTFRANFNPPLEWKYADNRLAYLLLLLFPTCWALLLGAGLVLLAELNIRPQPTARRVLLWGVYLVFGLILITGRYPWDTWAAPFSLRSLVASTYLFVPSTLLLYLLLERFCSDGRRRFILNGAWFAVSTLPYQWLDLRRYFSMRGQISPRPVWDPQAPPPSFDWFPGALDHLPTVPYENVTLFAAFAIGAAGILIYARTKAANGIRVKTFLPLVILAALVIQTWLHSGMRSPYVYRPNVRESGKSWYHSYVLEDWKGVVQGDAFVFIGSEQLFHGLPMKLTDVLLTRSFPMYVASQFTFFIHPFYFWTVANILFWGITVFAMFRFTAGLFDERAGLYAALITACSPLYIQWINQPMSYVFGYTFIALFGIIFPAVFRNRTFVLKDAVFLGLLFGAALFTQEFIPWLVVLVLVGRWFGAAYRYLFLSCFLAVLFPAGFVLLMKRFDTVHMLPNAFAPYLPMQQFLSYVQAGHWVKIYGICLDMITGFARNMGFSFNLSLILVLLLLSLANLSAVQRLALIVFALPALMTQIFMQFGGPFNYALSPRIIASAFPSVYAGAGAALAAFSAVPKSPLLRRAAAGICILIIGAHVYLANIDVFGYPFLYYLLHWANQTPYTEI